MSNDELRIAYEVAQEIASRFDVPVPQIIVGLSPKAQYVDGHIYLPSGLSPQSIVRIMAHEMAHHIHSYYGVPCNTREAEVFASMFEEAWVKMKKYGYSYPVMPCQICGYRLLMYGERVTCPKCGSVYAKNSNNSPGLGKAIALAILSGIGTYTLTTLFMTHPAAERRPAETSALASSLVGFLAGLIM
jgi:hypothetical protein